jgi:LPXTG-motif cell wall-anchored protein
MIFPLILFVLLIAVTYQQRATSSAKHTKQELSRLHTGANLKHNPNMNPFFSQLLNSFIIACKRLGYTANLISGLRTEAEQQRLVDAYNADPDHNYYAASPFESLHVKGLAADLEFFDDQGVKIDLTAINAIPIFGLAENMGLHCGASFTPADWNHFYIYETDVEQLAGQDTPAQISQGNSKKTSWILWVAIGVLAIGTLIYFAKKKKSAQVSQMEQRLF